MIGRDPMASVVRILKRDGASTAGTGFAAGKRLIVTCAHVVQLAGSGPGSEVSLVFHQSPDSSCKARVLAKCWRNPKREDVAVLELLPGQHWPLGVESLYLGSSYNSFGKTLRTFGFPLAKSRTGLNDECRIIGEATENGCRVLQIKADAVSFGFSGAPAWDADGYVLGMILSIIPADLDPGGRNADTAFIVPAETIREACLELAFRPGSPYRELEPFNADDSDLFFGRSAVIAELLGKLRRQPVVTIVGASGSGKSSMVRAGLTKGLSETNAPELTGRKIVIIKADSTPTLTLLAAIGAIAGGLPPLEGAPELATSRVSETPQGHFHNLPVDAIARTIKTLCRGESLQLLLVVDQFERVFTDCKDEDDQARFIELLKILASEEVKLLIALKADYYGLAIRWELFSDASREAQIVLVQMNDDELRETIVRPAELWGRAVEPSVVVRLVSDIRDGEGDLPLLQFGLSDLWSRDSEKGVLSLTSYEAMGYVSPDKKVPGLRGVMVRRAEEVWKGVRQDGQEDLAKSVLLSLVAVPNTGKMRIDPIDASRRARLSEFSPQLRKVAERLAASFLVRTDVDPITNDPIVEVAHEALIRSWDRLREWVEKYRPALAWYTQDLIPYFQRWVDEKEGKSFLLPSEMVAEASDIERKHPSLVSGPVAEYVRKSSDVFRRRKIRHIVLSSLAAIVLTILAFNQQYARRSRSEALHEHGVIALANHDFQSAQVLLAKGLTYHDDLEARQDLLESRASAATAEKPKQLIGGVIAVSSDGKCAAVKSADGYVHIYRDGADSTKTGIALTKELEVGAAFSKAGKLFAYGDQNGVVSAWDTIGDKMLGTVNTDAQSSIVAIAVTKNEGMLAFGTNNGTIGLVRILPKGLVLQKKFLGHDRAVHTLSFNPEGTRLVSGGADRTVRLWSTNGERQGLLGTHDDYVVSSAFSPDGTTIATGGADGAIRIWNPLNQQQTDLLSGHLGVVSSLAFSSDGNLIVSGSEDKTIRVWDRVIAKEIVRLQSDDAITSVTFVADTKKVLAGNEQGRWQVWDLSRRREGYTLYDNFPVASVAFHPDGMRIATAGLGSSIRVWDLITGTFKELRHETNGAIWSLAFRPNGQLASGGEDRIVRIWDVDTGHVIHAFPPQGGSVWSLTFHPTKPLLVAGEELQGPDEADAKIHIWDLGSWDEIKTLSHQGGSVYSLSFSPDGHELASGGGDSTVRLWSDFDDPRSVHEVKKVTPDGGKEVWGVPFFPDGKSLVSVGNDRRVRIWSVPDLVQSREFELRHEGIIQNAAISPDGRWIATASADHTVRLWDAQTKKVITVGTHERPAWWVAFSNDGRYLASAGLDQRIRIRSLEAIDHVLRDSPSLLLRQATEETCLQVRGDAAVPGACK